MIEHSALLHSAEIILKSAGIDPAKDMQPPRGTVRNKPIGLDLLYSLHSAARNSRAALKANQCEKYRANTEKPKSGRSSKKVNKGGG